MQIANDIDTTAAPALDANDAAALPNEVAPANETKDERDLRIAALERENAKLERRIGRKTHALGQAHERLSTYERSAPRNAPQQGHEPDDGDDADAVETRAEQIANERLQQREQTERAQRLGDSVRKMVENGVKLDPKFNELVNDLAQDIPMVDGRTGRATDFTVELLGCDNPAAVALYLVKNPAVAQSLEGMNARQMARKLDRIDAEVGKTTPATPSSAARPLTALNAGITSDNAPRDTDSPEEWRRKEAARINAKNARNQPLAAASR